LNLFVCNNSAAAIKVGNEFLYLCIDMGLERQNEEDCSTRTAHSVKTACMDQLPTSCHWLNSQQWNCCFLTILSKVLNSKTIVFWANKALGSNLCGWKSSLSASRLLVKGISGICKQNIQVLGLL